MDDDAVRQFRSQLTLLQRRLRREVRPTTELSRSALQVLGAISREPGCTPSRVSDEVAMTTSNVAAALRELDPAGLVLRTRDPEDARRVHLDLTSDGTALVARYRAERETWLGRAMTALLSEDEFAALMRAGELMQRIAEFEPAAVVQ